MSGASVTKSHVKIMITNEIKFIGINQWKSETEKLALCEKILGTERQRKVCVKRLNSRATNNKTNGTNFYRQKSQHC